MTDFHYLRLARAEFIAKREPKDAWREWRRIAPPEPLRSALVFGAVLTMCLVLAKRPQRADDKSGAPLPAHAEPASIPERDPSPPASEDNVFDGPWGRLIEAGSSRRS